MAALSPCFFGPAARPAALFQARRDHGPRGRGTFQETPKTRRSVCPLHPVFPRLRCLLSVLFPAEPT